MWYQNKKTMKKLLSAFFLLACLLRVNAQSSDSTTSQKIGGYRISQDEVIFSFNPAEYSDFNTSYGMWKTKKNFKIQNVTLCGEFNNWMTTAKNFQMTKIGEVYEFRMKLSDFKGKSQVEFKYVVNNKYWAEPKSIYTNLTRSLMEYQNPKNFILYLVQPENN